MARDDNVHYADSGHQVWTANRVLDEDVMRSELLTRHELPAALRTAGRTEIEYFRVATLEKQRADRYLREASLTCPFRNAQAEVFLKPAKLN